MKTETLSNAQAERSRSGSAYISYLNVISAVAVVLLHSNDAFWNFRTDGSWMINNIVECLCYFAVPIFFMLTGATLIDYNERYDTKTFFIKRLKKTFVPFVFWSLVPFIFSYILPDFFKVDTELSFRNIFNGLFNYGWFYYYWFFIPLFCIYLTIPLLALVQKEKRVKIFTYIAAVSFAINIMIPFFVNLLNHDSAAGLIWKYSVTIGTGYMFFVFAGYVLHKTELRLPFRLAIYALSVTGLMLHIFGTNSASLRDGTISDLYKGYENLPCVLYALGIFVFVKYAVRRINCAKLDRFIFRAQKYTLEIYLIHRIVYPFIEKLTLLWLPSVNRLSIAFTFITAPFLIIFSVLIAYILRKIPIIKYIVP